MTTQPDETLLEEFAQLLERTKEKRTLSNQTYNKNYYINNFKPLLELGNYFEKLSVGRIIKAFNFELPTVEFNTDNRYDIMINNITFEVKADVKCVQTSNIFIEFISLNKASGITTTKANYYVIVIPHKVPLYILIEVSKLQTLINDSNYSFIIQPSPKNNFTGGYIFKVEKLIQHSTLI